MPSILLTAPAVEPISLADMKAFLRIEHSDDDDTIAALIAGARLHIEAQTRRALITQVWRLTRDVWPASGVLRAGPGFSGQLIQEQHARIHSRLDDDPVLQTRVMEEIERLLSAA